jgi:hypothetical protein
MKKLEKFSNYKMNNLAMCTGGYIYKTQRQGHADTFDTSGSTNASMYLNGNDIKGDSSGYAGEAGSGSGAGGNYGG